MKRRVLKISCLTFAIVLMFSLSLTAFAANSDYMAEHGEEGEQLWKNYLEAIEPIKNGEYPEFTDFVEQMAYIDSPHYADLTYGEAQEFLDMSTYDKILWDSIIVYPFSRQNNGGNYYTSLDGWKGFAAREYRGEFALFCSKEDAKVMQTAYAELMEWLYYYYDSTGAFYNFIDGKDSFDYINEHFEHDDTDTDTEDTVVVSSSTEGNSYTETTSNVAEKRGVWDNFFDSIKNHLFTVILFVVLVVVMAVIAFYKKKFNIQNNDE